MFLLAGIGIGLSASTPFGQDPIAAGRTGLMGAAFMLIGFIAWIIGGVRWFNSIDGQWHWGSSLLILAAIGAPVLLNVVAGRRDFRFHYDAEYSNETQNKHWFPVMRFHGLGGHYDTNMPVFQDFYTGERGAVWDLFIRFTSDGKVFRLKELTVADLRSYAVQVEAKP